MHATQKIRWEPRIKDRPYLAERLIAKGYSVCSVVQIWDGEGNGDLSKITVDDVTKVLDPVAAYVPEDPSEFGDYVIHWKGSENDKG
jgi:hypothetical protein